MTQKVFTLDADFDIVGYTDKLEKNDDVSLKYLSDLVDDDCSSLTGWAEIEGGTAVAEVSPAGQFHFYDNDNINYALVKKDFGAFPEDYVFIMRANFDDLPNFNLGGGTGDRTIISISMDNGNIRTALFFAKEGVYVHDSNGAGAFQLIANSTPAEWGWAEGASHIWAIAIDGSAKTCNIYLDNVLKASNVACDQNTSLDGEIWLGVFGKSTDIGEWHIDWFKVATGLTPYADDSPPAKFKKSGEDYTINIGSGKKLKLNSFAATTSEPAGTSIKYRWVKDDNGTWPGAGWSAWLTSTELNTAMANGDLEGFQYIYVEMQLNSDGTDKCSLSDGTFNFTTLIRKIVDAGVVNKLVDDGVLAKLVG